MIIFVSASIYLPTLFIKPKYNFLYLSGENYYDTQYFVQDNKLFKKENAVPPPPPRQSKLFVYDITLNRSIEIPFEKAQKLTLDSNTTSVDGYLVTYGTSSGGFFPFFFYNGSDYDSIYLKNNSASKKLNVN